MTLDHSYHPAALEELEWHLRALDAVDPNFGTKAYFAYTRHLRRALEFPESCQVYWNEYRKFIPRPFKFMVLYKVAHGMVVVSAVVDARMDPSLIRDRLRSR
jgi:hypothetical protein